MTAGNVNKIIAWCLFVIMLGVYLMTVAPTLSFWDCGEFISCSYIMGIPHPPGSPLLSLIGRVFALIPFYDFRGEGLSEFAYRVNMIDVILGALTVMFTYLVMVRLIHKFKPPAGNGFNEAVTMFSAAITALIIGFSDEFWNNAIETETYMPSLFMSILAVWLTLRWDERSNDPKAVRYLFLASFLLGLGNGVHLTVLLIAPTIILFVLFARPKWFSEPLLWLFAGGFIIIAAIIKLFAGLEILYISMGVFALAAPSVLYIFYIRKQPLWILVLLGLITCFSLYILGFGVYPTVMVRAGKNPSINEGNPDNRERYKLYMSRDQYGQENMYLGMLKRNAGFKYQFGYMYLRYLAQQFPKWGPTISYHFKNNRSPDNPDEDVKIRKKVFFSPLLFSLLLYGFITHGIRDWKRFTALILFFIVSSIGLVLYLNMKNPQVRERAYFFLGSYYIIAYWIGMGMYGVITDIRDWFREEISPRILATITIALFVIFGTILPVSVLSNHIDPNYNNYQAHNRTKDWAPWDYAHNILTSCEQDAILFTNGDNDTFPLWYLQEVKGYRKDVRIVNLSLLNTDWYILQMKYGYSGIPLQRVKDMIKEGQILSEPGSDFDYQRFGALTIPIDFSDEFIEERLCDRDEEDFEIRFWPLEGQEVKAAGISWNIPSYHRVIKRDGSVTGMIRIQDVMVYKIIDWVNWSRPIYFAVTVAAENKIGLEEYLSMEGMVARLVKEPATPGHPNVNVPVLDDNIFNKYIYRSLTDDSIYKPPNTLKLVTNYFIGFAQLSERYVTMGDKEAAVRAARGAIERTTHDLSKRLLLYKLLLSGKIYDELKVFLESEINDPEFTEGREGLMEERLQVAAILDMIGENDKADLIVDAERERLKLKKIPDKLKFGTTLIQTTLDRQAYKYFKELINEEPENIEIWRAYFAALYATGRLKEAVTALDRMLELNPGDTSAKEARKILINQIRKKSTADSVAR